MQKFPDKVRARARVHAHAARGLPLKSGSASQGSNKSSALRGSFNTDAIVLPRQTASPVNRSQAGCTQISARFMAAFICVWHWREKGSVSQT